MNISFPDDILLHAEAGEAEIRLAVALQFYSDNRVDHAEACRLAGLPSSAFTEELLQRGLCVHIYPLRSRIREAG
ncbi:MAG TPA: UPF0175 family protein [Phycisphaerae bacterium]|nr:UPF0175 family protein [Phycisphaerae bacterium]